MRGVAPLPDWRSRGDKRQLDQRTAAGPHRYSCGSAPYQELRGNPPSESSGETRGAVAAAHDVQRARGYYNSQMPSRMIRKQYALDDSGERTLEMAVRRVGLSACAHDRILKVARTIADLGGSATVSAGIMPKPCNTAAWIAIIGIEHGARSAIRPGAAWTQPVWPDPTLRRACLARRPARR